MPGSIVVVVLSTDTGPTVVPGVCKVTERLLLPESEVVEPDPDVVVELRPPPIPPVTGVEVPCKL